MDNLYIAQSPRIYLSAPEIQRQSESACFLYNKSRNQQHVLSARLNWGWSDGSQQYSSGVHATESISLRFWRENAGEN